MNKQNDFESILVPVINPEAHNFIFGQSHFIKTVEDIHELMVSSVPGISFGLAFAEASGPRLIRTTGTSKKMTELALKNVKNVGCGHTFFLFLENAFPINILPALKMVPEVVNIFCATANPAQVIIARSAQGSGVCGVIDGGSPLGTETPGEAKKRKEFLRSLGYKLS
jgi:uncharacterized protein